MLQNALDLATETMAAEDQSALTVMNENGFALTAEQVLTRADCANLMYQVSVTDAPGKAIFNNQNQ